MKFVLLLDQSAVHHEDALGAVGAHKSPGAVWVGSYFPESLNHFSVCIGAETTQPGEEPEPLLHTHLNILFQLRTDSEVIIVMTRFQKTNPVFVVRRLVESPYEVRTLRQLAGPIHIHF